MREWSLVPGDPLFLTLAADFRFSQPDANDDQVWELDPGGGDPPALSLQTTYGLRARSMRIFPRFLVRGKILADPVHFTRVPTFHCFSSNFLAMSFSPLPELDVKAEYWVPGSHAVAGRITVQYRGGDRLPLALELCAQLVPLDGESFSPVMMRSANVLAGRSSNLSPVIFMTGGPLVGAGPYPALMIDLLLEGGSARTITWVHAARSDPAESFELARRYAASSWDAEQARIEICAAAQTVDIHTGDLDWDAALAFSQVAAFGLFMGVQGAFPEPSFVLGRQPDHGFSLRGDGLDHHPLWSGCSPLESYYLAQLLPGAPQLAVSALRNFLAVQSGNGDVDLRPGPAGQRGYRLATPILAALAWHAYERSGDVDLLVECFPKLLAFHRQWFVPAHDQDQDGFPEWDSPDQAGLAEHLERDAWQMDMGAVLPYAESPALGALLSLDGVLLEKMASLLKETHQQAILEAESARLRSATQDCWDSAQGCYRYRDRDSHRAPRSMQIVRQRGNGQRPLVVAFDQPTRVLVRVIPWSRIHDDVEIMIKGRRDDQEQTEKFTRNLITWDAGMGIAVSRGLFTGLSDLHVHGLGGNDRIILQTPDLNIEDISLLLPLWAGIPDGSQARAMVRSTICAAGRFGRPFGLPTWTASMTVDAGMAHTEPTVQMPWNHIIGEALLAYGFRSEAAQLTTRLMSAAIGSLKVRRGFSRAYQADTGAGLGDRNVLQGFAPVGLFLKTLGVEILSPRRVLIRGKNPFPWPVTVQYRGLVVQRNAEETQVTFADGSTMNLTDPSDGIVSADG